MLKPSFSKNFTLWLNHLKLPQCANIRLLVLFYYILHFVKYLADMTIVKTN